MYLHQEMTHFITWKMENDFSWINFENSHGKHFFPCQDAPNEGLFHDSLKISILEIEGVFIYLVGDWANRF
jgi:hypothetical protein